MEINPATIAPKVLLIEDDPAHQLWMRRLYSEACPDGEITVVGTLAAGREAYLGSQKYDIILLDLNLPDSQGADTVERVKNWSNGAAIVVLTGLVDDNLCSQSIRKGVDVYVEKDNLSVRVLRKNLVIALSRKAKKYESRAVKMRRLVRDLETIVIPKED